MKYQIAIALLSLATFVNAKGPIDSQVDVLAMGKRPQMLAQAKMLGADSSGGGDAIVFKVSPKTTSNEEKKFGYYSSYLRKIGHIPYSKNSRMLYSLDLVEMGIHESAHIPFNNDFKNAEDIACIEEYGCYVIENSRMFDELMEYDGFFGKKLNSSTNERALSYHSVVNTLVFKKLSDQFFEVYLVYDEMARKFERENRLRRFRNQEVDLSYLKIPEIAKAKKELEESERKFFEFVNEHYPTRREHFYDSKSILAIGIINKLKQIEAVNPSFSKKLEETLLELDWLMINLPLQDIKDEGEIVVKDQGLYQVANRKFGTVRISSAGWDKRIKLNDKKIIYPMTTTNKIALIFHEAIYQLTRAQGDSNAERARFITGLLFKSTKTKRNIKKAASLLLQARK